MAFIYDFVIDGIHTRVLSFTSSMFPQTRAKTFDVEARE